MDLRQLECFLAVCQELHFSRAAEKLHISQPSLSRHIKNLEAKVGMPLFDRIGRGIALTEAGTTLLTYARRIFHEIEQAEAAMRDLHGLQRGKLTIGALPTVGYLLPPVILQFKRLYPNIELSVLGLRAGKIIDLLLENELDFGIVSLAGVAADVETIPLFREPLALAVPKDHELATTPAVQFAHLAALPTVLLPPNYFLRRLIDDHCRQAGVSLTPLLEMSSPEALLQMVADGVGTTVLPARYIEYVDNPHIARVPLANPPLVREVGIAYRKGKFLCAASRTFIEQLTATGAHWSGATPQRAAAQEKATQKREAL